MFCCKGELATWVLTKPEFLCPQNLLSSKQLYMVHSESLDHHEILFTKENELTEKKGEKQGWKVYINNILKTVVIETTDPSQKFYQLLQDTQAQAISIGMQFKLNQQKYQVINMYSQIEDKMAKSSSFSHQKNSVSDAKKCRICFGTWDTDEDPLMNFCRCTGSVAHMHLQCFREWFIHRVEVRERKGSIIWRYGNVLCDVCKSPIQFTRNVRGRQYTAIDCRMNSKFQKCLNEESLSGLDERVFMLSDNSFDQRIDDSIDRFIELQSVWSSQRLQYRNKSKQQSIEEPVCVVLMGSYFNKTEIILLRFDRSGRKVIGSSSKCDIVTMGENISPLHAQIYYQNQQIYLQDINSTYGTYVAISPNREHQFSSKEGCMIQYSEQGVLYFSEKASFFSFLDVSSHYRIKLKK